MSDVLLAITMHMLSKLRRATNRTQVDRWVIALACIKIESAVSNNLVAKTVGGGVFVENVWYCL